MDNNNPLPPPVRGCYTAPNRQRPQQQDITAAGSSNIGSVRYTTPQEQRYIAEASSSFYQHTSQFNAHSIQNVELPDQLSVTNRLNTDKFVNGNTNRSDYSAYAARLSACTDFPACIHQPAEADLGHNDSVTCYQCDTALERWQPADKPSEQHVRWYPHCPYVHDNMDEEFIKQFEVLFKEKNELIKEKPSHKNPASSIPSFHSSDAFMAVTNDCGEVAKMEIEKAFIYYLEKGNENPTAHQIRSIVFCLKETPEDESSQSVEASYKRHLEEISEAKKLIQKKEKIYQNRYQEVSEKIKSTYLLSQLKLATKEEENRALQIQDVCEKIQATFLLSQWRLEAKEAANRALYIVEDDEFARSFHNMPETQHVNNNRFTRQLKNELEKKEAENLILQRNNNRSSRQLKTICALKNENLNLKHLQLCKICLKNPLNIALAPCGHVSTCQGCSEKLTNCPICRHTIDKKTIVYLA